MTGEMSRNYMLGWDDEFVKKCKQASTSSNLYKRYVDDSMIVTRAINRGWRYVKGRMTFSWKTWEEDNDSDYEARTIAVLASIANSINPSIQVTTDCPSNNVSGRMAVLDLELWVEEVNGVPRVMYSFYKKPIASKFTIMKRSAVPEKVKKNTLFQESLRRLLHICDSLPWSETVRHMDEWSDCMRSGYSHKERYEASAVPS